MRRDIRAQLDVDILEPSTLEFQVAVSPLTGAEVSEELSLELNGRRVEAQEVAGEHGNRIHRLPAERGNLKVSYTATILGQADEVPVEAADLSTYLRPSRYAEADKFFGFAAAEFGEHTDPAVLLEKVSSWVGARLTYSPGSSDPIDGAVDTLLSGPESAATTRTWWWRCFAPSKYRPDLSRSMRRAATPWTFTLWPRPSSTTVGEWWTQPAWHRDKQWSASPPDAMPPTPLSWITMAGRSC